MLRRMAFVVTVFPLHAPSAMVISNQELIIVVVVLAALLNSKD